MTTTFERNMTQKFLVVSCYTCGIPFGITSNLYKRVVTDATGSVYCPSCGSKTCWRESEHEKEKRRLKAEMESEIARVKRDKEYLEASVKRHRERADIAERSLTATRGVVTRIKNRVSKGVCPCCNRSFENLHRHMTTQHPEFAKDGK